MLKNPIDSPARQALPWSRTLSHEIRNPFKKAASFKSNSTNPLKDSKKPMRAAITSKFTPSELSSIQIREDIPSTPETPTVRSLSDFPAVLKVNSAPPQLPVASLLRDAALIVRTKELMESFAKISQVKLPSMEEIEERSVTFSKVKADEGKINLLLDLDETLIHVVNPATMYKSNDTLRRICKIQILENGEQVEYEFLMRPKLRHFLASLASKYDISVFTGFLN